MGIDPLTHEPIIFTAIDEEKPQEEEHKQFSQSKETETTSFQSISSVTESKEEEKSMNTSSFEAATTEVMNGFCTDEVPLIEPHEILVSCAPSSSSSSSSSTCSNFLEDLELPDFEWPCDDNNMNMCLWDDDFNAWDLLINDDNGDGDMKESVDPPLISQCPRMVLDQESWAIGHL